MLVIDVQGAAQVKRTGIDHTSIFVLPPTFDILERRLRGRSADSEAAMQRRLGARVELLDATACAELIPGLAVDGVIHDGAHCFNSARTFRAWSPS